MRHLVGLLAALVIAGPGAVPATAQPDSRNESAARQPAVGDGTLAIVPFVNLSGEPSDDWIGDGIVETTVAGLEQLDTVSILESAALVAAITEELLAYGQDLPSDPERLVRDVSRRLGAVWILTGSYERTDGALRFTARIVDVATGVVATGVAVDGGPGEIFDLQDRLVAEVAAALGRLQRGGLAPTAGEPLPAPRPSDFSAGTGTGTGTATASGVAAASATGPSMGRGTETAGTGTATGCSDPRGCRPPPSPRLRPGPGGPRVPRTRQGTRSPGGLSPRKSAVSSPSPGRPPRPASAWRGMSAS